MYGNLVYSAPEITKDRPMAQDSKALDSHLSMPGSGSVEEKNGVTQHHRLALGLKVTGMTNPTGSAPSTKSTIGNNQGKNY